MRMSKIDDNYLWGSWEIGRRERGEKSEGERYVKRSEICVSNYDDYENIKGEKNGR